MMPEYIASSVTGLGLLLYSAWHAKEITNRKLQSLEYALSDDTLDIADRFLPRSVLKKKTRVGPRTSQGILEYENLEAALKSSARYLLGYRKLRKHFNISDRKDDTKKSLKGVLANDSNQWSGFMTLVMMGASKLQNSDSLKILGYGAGTALVTKIGTKIGEYRAVSKYIKQAKKVEALIKERRTQRSN